MTIPGIKKNTPNEPNPLDEVKERIDALDEDQLETAWTVEAESWMKLGLNPVANIMIDGFHLKFRFDRLFQIVSEKLEIDLEEFDLEVKRMMLANMIHLRQLHERQLLHAKLTEGIQGPPMQIPILPPGTKM